jgi:hypothetical protein
MEEVSTQVSATTTHIQRRRCKVQNMYGIRRIKSEGEGRGAYGRCVIRCRWMLLSICVESNREFAFITTDNYVYIMHEIPTISSLFRSVWLDRGGKRVGIWYVLR